MEKIIKALETLKIRDAVFNNEQSEISKVILASDIQKIITDFKLNPDIPTTEWSASDLRKFMKRANAGYMAILLRDKAEKVKFAMVVLEGKDTDEVIKKIEEITNTWN